MPSTEQTIYVVGAGFSMAVSGVMPDTNKLGREIFDSLAGAGFMAPETPYLGGNGISFEQWLSWLAERQPYDSESEHHARRSQFFALQDRIAGTIRAHQREVERTGLPGWLMGIVDIWHHSRSTVVSLNYDTLVEAAVGDMLLFDDRERYITREDVTKIFPVSGGLQFGGPMVPRDLPTFDLYKLHGSIDWYWVPGDEAGASMELRAGPRAEELERDEGRNPALGGKVEFIVPPTSSKSDFFRNARTRYLWQESARGLAEAERVVLIGYSLPLNDSAMASMLAKSLHRSEAPVIVVNPDYEPVVDKLVALGIAERRIEVETSVERFVEKESFRLSRVTSDRVTRLLSRQSSSPVCVGWSSDRLGAVLNARFLDGTGELELTVGEFASVGSANGLRFPSASLDADLDQLALSLNDILAAAGSVEIRSVTATGPDGRKWIIGGLLHEVSVLGQGLGQSEENDWVVLRPVGQDSRRSRPSNDPGTG